MGRLDEKVAIVTGAASGIGKEIAILFAQEGARIVVADYMVDNGEKTVEIINKIGKEAIFIKTDVSREEDIINMVKQTINNFKKINILVNVAAILEEEGSIVNCSKETFLKVISVNLLGTSMSMKYIIPEIEKAGGGSIINFTSIAALEAYKGAPAYAASKGGVITVSRVAAIEYAAKNIRINCIAPSHIPTSMVLRNTSIKKLEKLAKKIIPMKRLGDTKEVAKVALFLASDDSSYITATTIVVDGGLTARIP